MRVREWKCTFFLVCWKKSITTKRPPPKRRSYFVFDFASPHLNAGTCMCRWSQQSSGTERGRQPTTRSKCPQRAPQAPHCSPKASRSRWYGSTRTWFLETCSRNRLVSMSRAQSCRNRERARKRTSLICFLLLGFGKINYDEKPPPKRRSYFLFLFSIFLLHSNSNHCTGRMDAEARNHNASRNRQHRVEYVQQSADASVAR